jgi:hypothetical protein
MNYTGPIIRHILFAGQFSRFGVSASGRSVVENANDGH